MIPNPVWPPAGIPMPGAPVQPPVPIARPAATQALAKPAATQSLPVSSKYDCFYIQAFHMFLFL